MMTDTSELDRLFRAWVGERDKEIGIELFVTGYASALDSFLTATNVGKNIEDLSAYSSLFGEAFYAIVTNFM
jgi:hypothetical protein